MFFDLWFVVRFFSQNVTGFKPMSEASVRMFRRFRTSPRHSVLFSHWLTTGCISRRKRTARAGWNKHLRVISFFMLSWSFIGSLSNIVGQLSDCRGFEWMSESLTVILENYAVQKFGANWKNSPNKYWNVLNKQLFNLANNYFGELVSIIQLVSISIGVNLNW